MAMRVWLGAVVAAGAVFFAASSAEASAAAACQQIHQMAMQCQQLYNQYRDPAHLNCYNTNASAYNECLRRASMSNTPSYGGGGGGNRFQQGMGALQGILGTLQDMNRQQEQQQRNENNRLGRQAESEGVDHYNSGRYEQALYAFQRGYQYFQQNGEGGNMAVMQNHINRTRERIERLERAKREQEEHERKARELREQARRWEEQHRARQGEREQAVKELFLSPSPGGGEGRANPFQQAAPKRDDSWKTAGPSDEEIRRRCASSSNPSMCALGLQNQRTQERTRLALQKDPEIAKKCGKLPPTQQTICVLRAQQERDDFVMPDFKNLPGGPPAPRSPASLVQAAAAPAALPRVEVSNPPAQPQQETRGPAYPPQPNTSLRPTFPSQEPLTREMPSRPECKQSDDAYWAEQDMIKGIRDPDKLLLAQQDYDRRRKLGCLPSAPPPVQAKAPAPEKPAPQVLSEEEAKKEVSGNRRAWTSPEGILYVIPPGQALYRMGAGGPLRVVPHGSLGEIPERENFSAGGRQCGVNGVGWVTPWCEEQRAKRRTEQEEAAWKQAANQPVPAESTFSGTQVDEVMQGARQFFEGLLDPSRRND